MHYIIENVDVLMWCKAFSWII